MNICVTINLGNYESMKISSNYYKKKLFRNKDPFELCLQELIDSLTKFKPKHEYQEKAIHGMIHLLSTALEEEEF